ncbi:MAG: hypothetical protein HY907_07295 [Deltaproteobacteria bacterium]|nr:hypothetical protein [Deltaproteobacteria bacterium]
MRVGIRGWLVGVLAVSWGAPAGAGMEPWFAPELYYGVGADAGFLGNAGELEVCAAAGASGVCLPLGEPAGGGASVLVGLRAFGWLGLELGYDVFLHSGEDGDAFELATLQAVRIGARFLLMPGSTFEPYLLAGGGLYLLGDEYDVAGVGGGFQVGAGVDVYLARALSLGASVAYRGVGMGSFRVEAAELPWGTEGTAASAFLHGASVRIDVTVHSVY